MDCSDEFDINATENENAILVTSSFPRIQGIFKEDNVCNYLLAFKKGAWVTSEENKCHPRKSHVSLSGVSGGEGCVSVCVCVQDYIHKIMKSSLCFWLKHQNMDQNSHSVCCAIYRNCKKNVSHWKWKENQVQTHNFY